MIDRTTKALLFAIACGLWVQVAGAWLRPAPTPPTATSAVSVDADAPNPYEQTIRELNYPGSDQAERDSFRAAGTDPAARAALVTRISARSGLPRGVVERGFDDMQKQARVVDARVAQDRLASQAAARETSEPQWAQIERHLQNISSDTGAMKISLQSLALADSLRRR